MAIRLIISAVVFPFVFANLSKADLNIYPERCDNEEINEYLEEYLSDFDLPVKFILGEDFRFDEWDASLDCVLKDETHGPSEKLVAILYLCKVAAEKFRPDDCEAWRVDLQDAILNGLEYFDPLSCRRLLKTNALKRLLLSLKTRFYMGKVVIKFRKADVERNFLKPNVLKKVLLDLWAKTRPGKLEDVYKDSLDSLDKNQLEERILFLWELSKMGDSILLYLCKEDFDYDSYYNESPTDMLDELLFWAWARPEKYKKIWQLF